MPLKLKHRHFFHLMKITKNIILCLLISCFSKPLCAQNVLPKADEKAMVIAGKTRFTILSPQLIRMEWSENGRFEDKASLVFINRKTEVPHYTHEINGEWLTIVTDKLRLNYKINSGKFDKENVNIRFDLNGKEVKWFPSLIDSLNLKGTTRTLDGTDGEQDVKLEDGLLSRSGWFLWDDSQSNLFDSTNWVQPRTNAEHQDWYFFGYGHDYKKELKDYTTVAGKIPMPPRYAFGYWWSRYWSYSDEELRNLITSMHSYQMPIDVLIIDMDWHVTDGLSLMNPKKDEFDQPIGWTGYTWNKNLFPRPQQFLDWTSTQHLKTALNLHPASGIAPNESMYGEFAKSISFDTSSHRNIPFKIEDKKWAEMYFSKVIHPLEKQGVDFWWLDWQQWLENKNIKNLSNTFWLNHAFFTDMEKEGDKRPMLFHRWGGMGNHRYQLGFSGDAHSTWQSLDYQSYFTATASNVGYGYWSHDIGGHVGDDNDPELYLRWIQFGVYSPILRTHCTKSKDIERRMYMYPKQFGMMLDALQMRYALNPYIYNASRTAYETGVSICRPMYYDYPEEKDAYTYNHQYLFGDDMMVAPIGSKSENELSIKKLWLPPGDWYELYTGTMLKGNKTYTRNYSLNEVPVFVKAGSIIPMFPKEIKNLQQLSDTLVLCFIPGGNSTLQLYDDDGISSDYKTNATSSTTISKQVNATGETIINIGAVKGSYKGMKTSIYYTLEFPSAYPPQKVMVNNREYNFTTLPQTGAWTYDADKLCVRILLPSVSRSSSTEVNLIANQNSRNTEEHLNGKIGLMNRSVFVIEKLKLALNDADAFANLNNSITQLGALKTNIRYQPENTAALLIDFDKNYESLIHDIKNYSKLNENVRNEALQFFENGIIPLPLPKITADKTSSDVAMKVSISSGVEGAKIVYTTDNSIPTIHSTPYTGEFFINKTCQLKARSYKNANMQSEIASLNFQRKFASNVTYKYPCGKQYNGGNAMALVDGVTGSEKDFSQKWIGFQGVAMIATVELKNVENIKSITTTFLEANVSWIFAPTRVKYEVSADGTNFKEVYSLDMQERTTEFKRGDRILPVGAHVNESNVKYVRITAENIGICPPWHSGAGNKAWLFVDELVIE